MQTLPTTIMILKRLLFDIMATLLCSVYVVSISDDFLQALLMIRFNFALPRYRT